MDLRRLKSSMMTLEDDTAFDMGTGYDGLSKQVAPGGSLELFPCDRGGAGLRGRGL